MFASVAALHRVVLLIAEHGAAGDLPVAHGLALWLAQSPGDAVSFDAAMRLPPTWRAEWRRSERDQALRRLRAQHFPTLSGREAARAIAEASRRYEAAAWHRDRRDRRRPDGLHGAIYDVLTFGGPPGVESLRRLFAADRPCAG